MSKEFDESRRLFGEMFPDTPKEQVDEMFAMLVDAVDKALLEAASKDFISMGIDEDGGFTFWMTEKQVAAFFDRSRGMLDEMFPNASKEGEAQM